MVHSPCLTSVYRRGQIWCKTKKKTIRRRVRRVYVRGSGYVSDRVLSCSHSDWQCLTPSVSYSMLKMKVFPGVVHTQHRSDTVTKEILKVVVQYFWSSSPNLFQCGSPIERLIQFIFFYIVFTTSFLNSTHFFVIDKLLLCPTGGVGTLTLRCYVWTLAWPICSWPDLIPASLVQLDKTIPLLLM